MTDRMGVLLPLRLETRFLAPGTSAADPGAPDPDVDPQRWRLRLRILPDEASIDHHQPTPTLAELAHVQGLWDTLHPSWFPDDPGARLAAAARHDGWADAFARVAAATGPARAHWLLANLDVSVVGGPAAVRWSGAGNGGRAHPRIVGLPARLDVWAIWTGSDAPDAPAPLPELLGDPLEPRPVGDSLDLGALASDMEPDDQPWWASWEAAERDGLAIEILLDHHPEEIEVLGVSGLGPGDGTAPADLFRNHAAAGRFGVLRPGVPTSTIFGGATIDTEQREYWARHDVTSPPESRDVIRLLTGATDIGPVPTDPALATHQRMAEVILGACYPALWGYGLSGVLNMPREAEEIGGLWEWALRRLRPEGTHPPVRIGDQAYAVLPLAVPSDAVQDRVRAAPTSSWAAVGPMLPMLGRIVRRWAAAARHGDAGADLAGTLVTGPVPSRLRWRQLVPVVLDASSHGVSPVDAMQEWFATHWPTAEVLGIPDWPFVGRAYMAAHRSHPLDMALIGPGLDHADTEIDEDQLRELGDWVRGWLGEIELDGMPIPLPEQWEDWDRRPVDSLLLTLFKRSLFVSVQLLAQCGLAPPDDPAHRIDLLEPLVPIDPTRACTQRDAFWTAPESGCQALLLAAAAAWGESDGESPAVAVWRVIEECRHDPSVRSIATRALRATVAAASGRWDTWLDGIGAAHADDALDGGAVPTLGAYGWVERPYRGTPGPGPGGLLLAPSQAQAATLAVLRDRAVHAPDRHGMDHASDLVGPARRWLVDVGQGWHPAELAGRLLEWHISEHHDLEAVAAQRLLADLREAAPLREGQGGFGCTHGLEALRRAGADAAAPFDHPAVIAAAARVGAMLDVAADLVLAEGVHNFLAARPGRAVASAQALGGSLPPPRLSVLDADWPTRAVQTTILLALPSAPSPRGVGPASRANPTLDAALRTVFPRSLQWQADVGTGDHRVTAADLQLGLLDLATLDDRAVSAMVGLAAAAGLGTPSPGAVDGPPAAQTLASMAEWCARVRGRPADVADLRPEVPPDAHVQGPTDRDERLRRRAARRLLGRIRTTRNTAIRTAARIEAACAAVLAREEARLAAAEGPIPSVPDEPVRPGERRKLARLAVLATGWGFSPPDCGRDLVGEDIARAQRARADLVAHLADCAVRLRARVATVEAVPGVAAFLDVEEEGVRAVDASANAPTLAAALGELVGRPRLSFGSRLPTDPELVLEVAGPTLRTDWATTVSVVRPDLARIVVDPPQGLDLHATDADDPWRVGALATAWQPGLVPALPRLTVVLASDLPAAGADLEWTTLDAFSESVPDGAPIAGAAFDTATPSASPPQAILVVPAPVRGSGGPTDEEVRSLVAHARTLAHGRMSDAASLTGAGLGPLASMAVLPQDDHSGAPLHPAVTRSVPTLDLPAVLEPHHDDADDVVAAVTGDPLWMLGAQWRLGEHDGEDAATPLWLESTVTHAPIGPAPARPARDPRHVPIEACIEGDPTEAERHPVAASSPEPLGTNWVSDRLEYETTFPLDDATHLHVARHDGGPAQWWAMTADGVAAPGVATEFRTLRPGRLEWPGQPRGRHWQIEDRRRDPAGEGPDLTQPATLHLIDILASHGEDLFVAPVPARAGTILRPGPVTMVDAAGGRWLLRPPSDWALMRVAGLDDPPPADGDDPTGAWQRGLPILLDAEAAIAGPVVDDLAVAVDEDDNLVWAAELVVDGAMPRDDSLSAPIRPRTPLDGSMDSATWQWRIDGAIPTGRHPFLHGSGIDEPAAGAGEDVFVRARLADPGRSGAFGPPPRSELLADVQRLLPLAVPASGVRLVRRPMLARAVDGSPVLWLRRSALPLDVPIDVDLRWDILVPDQD